jgi:hypothetical protein
MWDYRVEKWVYFDAKLCNKCGGNEQLRCNCNTVMKNEQTKMNFKTNKKGLYVE